jgi:hypothetical protein
MVGWGGLVCGRERSINEKGKENDSKRELKVDRKIVGQQRREAEEEKEG